MRKHKLGCLSAGGGLLRFKATVYFGGKAISIAV